MSITRNDRPFDHRYIAAEWQLIGAQIMLHTPTDTLFEIKAAGQALVGEAVHIPHADVILSDDFEMCQRQAVPAYLDAVGFGNPEAPRPN